MAPKNRTRFRPLVEQLETVMLLSQAPVASLQIHAQAAKPPVVVAPVDVHLAGILRGSGKLSGSVVTASGSGNLGKVGSASFKLTTSIASPPSTVTLSTKKGNLTLVADGALTPLPRGYSAHYEVEGGTKSYHLATGSGTVTATYTLLKGNKVTLTFKFS